jgi:hypothetical protein
MIDYYLKFKDEAEANEVLKDYTGYIDVIGTIYKPTGLSDSDGNPIMVDLEGWHVNLRCDETSEFDVYLVYPQQPTRVWA